MIFQQVWAGPRCYAINVETGERLNIIFGEDSWLAGDNGNDMIFNPTSRIITNLAN